MQKGIRALFPGEVGPVVERRELGCRIELVVRGLPVLVFDTTDPVGRNVAIASLLHLGMATDPIGVLCGASHGHVCKVRARLREGGIGEVVRRGKLGRPRRLEGSLRSRVVRLHEEGLSCRAIAREVGVSSSVVHDELRRVAAARVVQTEMVVSDRPKADEASIVHDVGEMAAEPAVVAPEVVDTPVPIKLESKRIVQDTEPSRGEELEPGTALANGPTEHPTRYAGLLLLVGALAAIGVSRALTASRVSRPERAAYDAHTVLLALIGAWGAGHPSLESMHERDARALGVILGLERSPSVRTLHRAIAQMRESFDPSAFAASWMRALSCCVLPERLVFGADGHFKPYSGDEPIDKGWDAKKRLATKGLMDIVLSDERGWLWHSSQVAAGDALSQHVLQSARRLRAIHGSERPIVLAFDRGGFAFDVLDALDQEGFGYVAYVPWSVKLPALAEITPVGVPIGERAWDHESLSHRARLVVERDGEVLVPITTNLTTLVEPTEVVHILRRCRGAQENAFKAARAHAHIDRLVDRGASANLPDDRPIYNPARTALKKERLAWMRRHAAALAEHAVEGGRTRKEINGERFRIAAQLQLLDIQLRRTPAQVPRVSVEPQARKAILDTRNRALLQPMKLAMENARRWLLATLGNALAPTDHDYDMDATARTLAALLRAPGLVRFDRDTVHVTLDLQLPPAAHARLDTALRAMDHAGFCFVDGRRRLALRLAPRPTRERLPHVMST